MKTLLYFIAFVLILDILSFIAWNISGQVPQDGFYIGAITEFIISLIN